MIHCEVSLCVGCRMCEVACSTHHFGAVSPVMSRIRVAKLEQTGIETAVACLSCTERYCLVCTTDALSVADNGVILLDADLCSACKLCMEACPIGAVGFYDDLPLFCDLCDGATPCVHVCPSGALTDRNGEEVSLAAFERSEGHEGQRRARFARVQGRPVRESWQSGRRVDS